MKIHQTQEFSQITITLETAEDAEIFWGIITLALHSQSVTPRATTMCIDLSNAFSNDLQLGSRK